MSHYKNKGIYYKERESFENKVKKRKNKKKSRGGIFIFIF
jgi:hypothetical protein